MTNSSTKPALSVVLGSYNRKRFLKLTIASIRDEMENLAQPFEIIVVDGGSSDGTLPWLVKQKDIMAIIQHNHGTWQGKPVEKKSWGYFMNLGFKAAQGKYVCMLSDDCLIVPGAIRHGYNLFEERLHAGEKIGAMAFYWRDVPGPNKYWIGTLFGGKVLVNHGIFLKQALEDVRYIDEDAYRFYCADGDLCLRIYEEGYNIIDSPDSYIEHYAHANMRQRKSNAQSTNEDKKCFLDRWSDIFEEEVSEKNLAIEYIKEYIDPFKTAKKFKSVRPIDFYMIKQHIKHKVKELFPRLTHQIKTLSIRKS